MAKYKKVSIDGKFKARYGATVRKNYRQIMEKMKSKTTKCPRCQSKKSIHRISTGIWHCNKCNAKFTGGAYFIETPRGAESFRVAKRKQRESEIKEE